MMAHDRNEKHEELEDSEYHFSDDEISYEVETEHPNTTPAAESKKGMFAQLSKFKRLIASVAIFFVLIIVLYKMLSPSPSPVADIVPASSVTESAQTIQEKNTPQTSATRATSVNQTLSTSQTNPSVQAVPYGAGVTKQEANVPFIQQTQANLFPATPNTVPAQQMLNEVSSIANIEAKISTITSESEKRIHQLDTDYTQKLNDYAAQNKQLQDQVQSLTAKIGSLETQMNQLMQVLMQKNQSNNTTEISHENVSSSSESKVPYNVQAIIPGRAWLKSENGETVTVAEGDMIKGLGRVTKIDPYDGIVEINTGNKAVSLSYGSGG
jgi:hypothetical protein